MLKRFRKYKATVAAKSPMITMPPKGKPAKLKLVTDTSCQGLGKMSWENVYKLLEKENPRFVEAKATVPDEADSNSDSESPLGSLANSFLHRVVARANIFLYYDVIRWVIDNVSIKDRTFVSASGAIFGSFRPEEIKAMYHLHDP